MMNPLIKNRDDGRREGERRKQAALDLHEAHRERLVITARRELLRPLLAGVPTATADDIRAAVELPRGTNPKAFGAAPAALARAGIIEPAGFVKTARPEAHARPVLQWRLRDRAKAESWWREHTEPPDDDPPAIAVQRDLFPTNDPTKSGAVEATTTPVE